MNRIIPDPHLLSWTRIESCMSTFRPASSGFTLARRGQVTLLDGKTVFIKIGTDDRTRKWISKEIDAYTFLKFNGYPYIPDLLSTSEDFNAFALSFLGEDNGWEWETNWTELRLSKTLEAMDALANIETDQFPDSFNQIRMMKEIKNSWQTFSDDVDSRCQLEKRLITFDRQEIAQEICSHGFLAQKFNFDFPQNTLVHYDVRSDNCAWNPVTQQVKLIDWNWIQLGNKEIDTNALLVSVAKSGYELTSTAKNRLHKNALMWLAGSWFAASIQPIDGSSSESGNLRDYQLESAIVAYELATSM